MSFESYHVSGYSIVPSSESEESIKDDPRGLVLMFHPPKSGAKYIMGCDPTVGITGWNRGMRIDDDKKIDNGAIEIYQVDALRLYLAKDGKPVMDPVTKQQKYVNRDLQVCEYAAPVDAVEIARVCNILGRVYAGSDEDQCELIYESYPGPGVLTTQELLRLGYGNLWQWEYFADSVAEQTHSIGWRSNVNTQKILWYRSRRHLMDRQAKIQSIFLQEEYANAVIDIEKMRAKAAYGYHDDRMQASNMCFWAGHKWSYEPERTDEPVVQGNPSADWQNRAPVMGESSIHDQWQDTVDSWLRD